ncbi:hypothetical protein DFH09DRAFT_1363869 [Mycena vulgaris]|nr:hypothetical protein DFH09DRAFT_1363869 [Mycena vulgaris]
MSLPSTNLTGLGEDILLRILSSSDIYTTLRVSQVNRFLCEIAAAKQLWVLHLQDLRRRSLIELPPSLELENLSTPSLVDLVRCLITGPVAWADGSSPTPSTEISIIPAEQNRSGRYHHVKLLNGGKYLFCQCDAGPELWDVASRRVVWTQPLGPRAFSHVDTAFTDEGNVRLIVIPGPGTDVQDLEIHDINPRTGDCTPHFFLRKLFPIRSEPPKLCGNFVLLRRSYPSDNFLLIDWRSRKYIFAIADRTWGDARRAAGPDYAYPEYIVISEVDVLPGHIIVSIAHSAESGTLQMHLYDLNVLADAWHPVPSSGRDMELLQNPDRGINLETCPHVVLSIPLDAPHERMTTVATSVHENPLKRGTYKLVMYVTYDSRDERVFWYSCIATINAPGGHATLKYVSSGRTSDNLARIRQTSYAGYMLDGTMDSTEVVRSRNGSILFMHGEDVHTDLSSYSGVVTRVTEGGVVLFYYS